MYTGMRNGDPQRRGDLGVTLKLDGVMVCCLVPRSRCLENPSLLGETRE